MTQLDTIASQSFLVHLSISLVGSSKKDDDVKDEVAVSKNAKKDMFRVIKSIYPAEALKPVKEIVSRARNYAKEHTSPWDNAGQRLLSAKKMEDFLEHMKQFEEDFWIEVDSFCANYKATITEAKNGLDQLWKEEDYPSESEIRSKFGWTLDYGPVPLEGHFILNTEQKNMDALRKLLTKENNARHTRIMKDLWFRMYQKVKHFQDALEENKVIRGAVLENVLDVCDMLREMNVANDPELESMCNEVEQAIGSLDHRILTKKDTENREKTKEMVKGFTNKLESFMAPAETDPEQGVDGDAGIEADEEEDLMEAA
jgi:hypothetical protein